MRKISDEELRKILNLHEKWLRGGKDGVRADLSWTNLSDMDLSHVNLIDANLDFSVLENSDLSYSDFTGANFFCANLKNANLSYAILNHANFLNACLAYTNLNGACLDGSILINTDLTTVKHREKQNLFLINSRKCKTLIGHK